MSWPSANQKYRQPLSIDNTAGGSGSFDASAAIPAAWSQFWGTVQSTGNDIRVYGPDGETAASKFDLESFNTTTKVGTLEIQDTAPAAGMLLYWLVWGDDSLSTGETPFVPASAKSMYFDLGVPVPGFTFPAQAQERLDSTDALNKVAKTSDSTIHVWMDFGALLQRREFPNAGTKEYECLSYVTVTAAVGLTSTASAIRFETSGGAVVRARLSGGTTANEYLVTFTAVTTLGRTLTGKLIVSVRDIAT